MFLSELQKLDFFKINGDGSLYKVTGICSNTGIYTAETDGEKYHFPPEQVVIKKEGLGLYLAMGGRDWD